MRYNTESEILAAHSVSVGMFRTNNPKARRREGEQESGNKGKSECRGEQSYATIQQVSHREQSLQPNGTEPEFIYLLVPQHTLST